MEPKRMAFLGTGNVGRALATGLGRHGHEVALGSRKSAEDLARAEFAASGWEGRVLGYAEAASWAEWVFVCVPGQAVDETAGRVPPEAVAGKVVIDVTNRMWRRGESSVLPADFGVSASERLQAAWPEARVVKAFNTVGSRLMVDPDVPCPPPTMPLCGEDEDAKAAVYELLADIGWEPGDIGGLDAAAALEAMAVVWVRWGQFHGSWTHAFKIVR